VYEILWTERIRKFTMIMIWFDLDENPEYRVSRHFDLSTDIVSVRECKTEYR
jgi:hypothetical protein